MSEEILTIDNELLILLAQNKRREATEKVVNTILNNEHIKTTRSDDKSEMWIYKKGIYLPEGRSYIKQWSRALFGEAYTSHLYGEIINKIEVDTYVDEKEFFNEQNKNPYLLPVKNGLLNVKTRQLKPHTHTIAYFNKINAEYQPEAKCPNIKKFIEEILPSKEDEIVIQEMIGYCLLRKYKYEKSFMLYGSHGRNGKSKLLELITRFIGVENVTGVSLQDIEKDDFAASNLVNKLVNISGDISNEALKNTGVFRSLTGGDTISANRKFKNRIDFVNYAKLIFAANELPPVYSGTDAFWHRWILIEFPYQFLPKQEIEGLNEEEKLRVKKQEQGIIDKIVSEEEFNGFLNYSLDGLTRLEHNKEFSTTKLSKDIKRDWLRKSNSVAAFVEDCIEEEWGSQIIKKDFLKKYQEYCKFFRLKILSDKVIKSTLKDELGIGEARPSFEGIQQPVWDGIRFKLNSKGSKLSDDFSTLREIRKLYIGEKTLTNHTTLTNSDEKKFTKLLDNAIFPCKFCGLEPCTYIENKSGAYVCEFCAGEKK